MSLYDEVMGLTIKQVSVIIVALVPVFGAANYFARDYVKKAIAEEGFASKAELEAQKKLIEEAKETLDAQREAQGILNNKVGQIQVMQDKILEAILNRNGDN
jgi:hypothetical protein